MSLNITTALSLKLSSIAVLTAIIPISALAADPFHAWDDENDPSNIVSNIEYRMDQLPISGDISQLEGKEKKGWPDYYWAQVTGGIAYRWQTESFFKNNDTKNQNKALAMSPAEINLLSPAEKFDLYSDDYRFLLTKKIRKDNDPDEADWRGICDGWSAASIQFDEPQSKVVTNKNNLTIPFQSSDIKALLAYYIGRVSEAGVHFLGTRCTMNEKAAKVFQPGRCGDVHPAALHLVLANQIGIQKLGLIGDLSRFKEVWNYPIVAYKFELGRSYKQGSKTLVSVKTTIRHKDAIDPSASPVLGTAQNKNGKKVYTYTLELDSAGKIVGGEWNNDSDRPDFIWTRGTNHGFYGKWAKLKELL